MPVNSKTAERNGMPSSVLVAHIAIGVMVTMFLLPGGVVVPRIVRGLTTSMVWFPLHIAVQGGLCLLFLLITLGTGASFGNTSSTHRSCGIALFVFFLVQCLLGIVAHWVKLPDRLKRFTFTTKRGRCCARVGVVLDRLRQPVARYGAWIFCPESEGRLGRHARILAHCLRPGAVVLPAPTTANRGRGKSTGRARQAKVLLPQRRARDPSTARTQGAEGILAPALAEHDPNLGAVVPPVSGESETFVPRSCGAETPLRSAHQRYADIWCRAPCV